jgi:hypothetical protein
MQSLKSSVLLGESQKKCKLVLARKTVTIRSNFIGYNNRTDSMYNEDA